MSHSYALEKHGIYDVPNRILRSTETQLCKTHKTRTMPRKPEQTGPPILGTTPWQRTWEHSPCLCACCLVIWGGNVTHRTRFCEGTAHHDETNAGTNTLKKWLE